MTYRNDTKNFLGRSKTKEKNMEILVQTKMDTQQLLNQSQFQIEAYIQIQKLVIQPVSDYAQWAKILECNLPEYAKKSREYTLTWWPKLGMLNPQNPEDLAKKSYTFNPFTTVP
ncbi:hypothetical protein ACTXT7_007190 [Hymenolepis weldensis]